MDTLLQIAAVKTAAEHARTDLQRELLLAAAEELSRSMDARDLLRVCRAEVDSPVLQRQITEFLG